MTIGAPPASHVVSLGRVPLQFCLQSTNSVGLSSPRPKAGQAGHGALLGVRMCAGLF